MTNFLRRVAFALGLQKRPAVDLDEILPCIPYDVLHPPCFDDLANAGYLSDFGPNVPMENLGGKPVFYENGQPVYPGREKAP